MRRTVLVVDAHPLYREALARLLGSAGDFEVVAVAGSMEQVAPGVEADVVVLDLDLPGVAGAAAVRALAGGGRHVLVLTAYADRADLHGAHAAGALGCLTKDADREEILAAVRTVAAGRTFLHPSLAVELMGLRPVPSDGPELALSDRERSILVLLAGGDTDLEIARELGISVKTVRAHLDRIRDKTGHRRRADLTRLALQYGIAALGSAAQVRAAGRRRRSA